MGVAKSQKHEEKGKNSKRGSVNNDNRLAAFAKSDHTSGGDWLACDGDKIQAVVVKITALGGAVTFGLSRDKSSHMLTLLLDDSRETMWYNQDAVLNDELDMVIGTLDAMT